MFPVLLLVELLGCIDRGPDGVLVHLFLRCKFRLDGLQQFRDLFRALPFAAFDRGMAPQDEADQSEDQDPNSDQDVKHWVIRVVDGKTHVAEHHVRVRVVKELSSLR